MAIVDFDNALRSNFTLQILEETFREETQITSDNCVILCDSIESYIEITLENLNNIHIA